MTTEPVVPNTGPSSAQHLLDLSFLDEDERKKIEDVLKRSCDEMKTEENRLNKLHTEIDEEHKMMRQHVQESSGRACPLCSTRFGIILNTGARCPHCFYKVCKQCRIPPRATVDFVCTLCEKRRVYRLGTSKVLKYEPSSPQDDDEIFGTQLVLKSLRNLEQFNRDFPQGELSRVMTLPAKRIMKSGPADERRLRQAKKVHPSQTPEGENERKENSNTINTLDLATQSQKVATTVEKNAPTEQKTVKEDKGLTDKKQKTGAEGNVRKESVLEAATKLPRRNSMSSQYSDYSGGSMRGDYDITGDILFGVEYFDGKVIVNVKRARGLAAVDRNGRADPYVKAYLLPDPGKESKKKTRVVKKNLDPIFNESLSYNVPQSEVAKKTLWLSVWDWDRFGRNSFLGEVRVPLSELDLSEKMEKWWPLVDTVESGEEGNHGEIYLLLKAEPMGTSGLWSIAVNVKEGQNLPHKKHGGVDSFVKCCVLPDVKHCQKTKIVHDSSSPTWNTVLYFEELHPTQLDVAACLEVTVWDKGSKRNSHQFIGGLRIGPSPTTAGAASKEWLDSTPEEMSHWTTMMSSVGVWVGKWLPLRGTMRPRNSPGKSKSRSSSLKRLAKSNFSASSRANRSSLTRRSDSPKSMSPGDPPNSSPTQGDPPSSSPAPEIVVDEEVTPNERRTDVEDVAGALSGGMRRSGSMGSLGSMQSTYSGEGGKGDYDITGEVLFGVQYSDGVLQIHVTSARDIAAASKGHTSNPYVKTYLLPDPKKSSKKKTRVVQKSLSPVYNEVLKYNVPQSEVAKKTLWLSVWDWDRFGRNSFLGEVRVPLLELDLSEKMEKWWPLCDKDAGRAEEESCGGEVLLGVMFEPPHTLHVKPKQGRNLHTAHSRKQDTVDAFVKCYLLPDNSSKGKRKTQVIKNNRNPVWMDKISYTNVSLEELSTERALEVTIWHIHQRSSNEFIGGLRLGGLVTAARRGVTKEWMDSSSKESTHWQDALANPGKWVEVWHVLRLSMITRKNVLEPSPSRRKKHSPLVSHSRKSSDGSITMKDMRQSRESSWDSEGSSSHTPLPPTEIVRNVSVIAEEETPAIISQPPPTDKNDDSMFKKPHPPKPSPHHLSPERTETNLKRVGSEESLTSFYSTMPEKGDYTITGEVLFGVEYVRGELLIHVNRARDIAAADKSGTSDAYVKTYLLPDKKKETKKKTRIIKKTLNPVYNETLKYNVPQSELPKKTLWLSVWDWDRFGKNSFLGEVRVPLSELDLSEKMEKWWPLYEKDAGPQLKAASEDVLPPMASTATDVPSKEVTHPSSPKVTSTEVPLPDRQEAGEVQSIPLTSPATQTSPASLISPTSQTSPVSHIFITPQEDTHPPAAEDTQQPTEENTHSPAEDKETGDHQTHPQVSEPFPPPVPVQPLSVESSTSVSVAGQQEKENPSDTLTASAISISGGQSPLSNLKRTRSKESLTSFYSTMPEKGDYTITGEVLFGVEYVRGELLIHVNRARDIAAADKSGTSDAYVKTYLLPDKKKETKKKTQVVKKSLNPVYNETLKYNVAQSEVAKKTLCLSVWDWDRFGRNSFLGEVCVPLSELDLSEKMEKWWPLVDTTSTQVHKHHSLRRNSPHKTSVGSGSVSLVDSETRKPDVGLGSVSPSPKEDSPAITISPPTGMEEPHVDESRPLSHPHRSPERLQTNLKRVGSKESLTSFYSTMPEKGDYTITGEVLFGVEYSKGKLVISVNRARDIAAADKSGTSDAYVKTYLLPDKKKETKKKTKVVKKSLNPVYNETLKYNVPQSELPKKTLCLSVWDWDRFGRNSFLGEVCVPLSELDLSEKMEKWWPLVDTSHRK